MISKGDNIVVGFSGGPDSLCLLHVLMSLREEYNISINAAHINHMIRGEEANRDEELSRKFCIDNNINFHLKREDVTSLAKRLRMSSEEAGRKVRYDFFNEIIKSIPNGKIALAHNLNDNGETIIMRFLRGTSLSGMAGISPKRDNIIRPIVNCTRTEIENYCSDNNLTPVIDSTNLQDIYTRNKIRLNVIPYIEKNFNKNILENLHTNSKIARDEEDMILTLVKENTKKIKKEKGYCVKEFNNLHIAMRRRIIRCIISDTLKNLNGIESKHIDLVVELIKKEKSGKRLDIKKGLILSIDYDKFNIFIKEKRINTTNEIKSYNILDEGISINGYKFKASIVHRDLLDEIDYKEKYFDFDKIGDNVKVRLRQNGDYMYLKGLKGRKKLKDIFIDLKIPREIRNSIPVIAVGSEVLVIPGIKDSISYSLDDETNNILKVKIEGV